MIDKYLKITTWARRRYADRGYLVISVGDRLSRYSQIERSAWDRYMGAAQHCRVED